MFNLINSEKNARESLLYFDKRAFYFFVSLFYSSKSSLFTSKGEYL